MKFSKILISSPNSTGSTADQEKYSHCAAGKNYNSIWKFVIARDVVFYNFLNSFYGLTWGILQKTSDCLERSIIGNVRKFKKMR